MNDGRGSYICSMVAPGPIYSHKLLSYVR